MNAFLVAGTLVSKDISESGGAVTLRISRSFLSDAEYDDLIFHVSPQLFKAELMAMEQGGLVGVKGRCQRHHDGVRLVAERVQIY